MNQSRLTSTLALTALALMCTGCLFEPDRTTLLVGVGNDTVRTIFVSFPHKLGGGPVEPGHAGQFSTNITEEERPHASVRVKMLVPGAPNGGPEVDLPIPFTIYLNPNLAVNDATFAHAR